ncbi:MAG: hypothetical protein LBS86_04040 [Treponema sp.]|jgi:hypothetical protein|nr:hypothetical protein [Treponema sp.]
MIKQCFFLVCAVIVPMMVYAAGSCSRETVLKQALVSVSAEAPVFTSCEAFSPTELRFHFSMPVTVTSLHFDRPLEIESISNGAQVTVMLKQAIPEGISLSADLLVQAERGDTLNVLIPFTSRNSHIPSIRITELRTEYSKPKVEFVEFKTASAGNLGSLRVFIASNGMDAPVFTFPSVEVRSGEYILVHLRSLEEGLLDETGPSRAASPGTEAPADARDFWVPGTGKLLRKTDAVLLMDQDDKILDAVLLSDNTDPAWAKSTLTEAAALLKAQNVWKGTGNLLLPTDAVPSTGTTATRSISRAEARADSDSAADWYVTATSGASPGAPNSDKRYVATPKR